MRFLVGIVWSASLLGPHSVHALPRGFIEEPVASQRATAGAFAPNPRNSDKPMLIISSKKGEVHVLENPDESSKTFQILDLDGKLCTNGERGLHSIIPHPDFKNNRYIYMSYTGFRKGCLEDLVLGPRNVVSRFLMDPDTLHIDIDSEEILLLGSPTPKMYHNGGAMVFGNSRHLYVTTGDGGGDRFRTSQNRSNLHGNILRINDDGTVPEDNPFTTQSGYQGVRCGQSGGDVPSDSASDAVCSEIFASGLRNPFRMSMNQNVKDKDIIYVADVGGAVWEELNVAGTDHAGKNYGWPAYEGPCQKGSNTDCSVPGFADPAYFYEHRTNRQGGAITGSTFVPEGVWPSDYIFLFIDFIFLEIYNLIQDDDRECRACTPPIPGFRNETFYASFQDPDRHVNEARMVDTFFGPYKDTQALYVFKYGSRDNILRIRYIGDQNRPPVPRIEVANTVIGVGEPVVFDGSGSVDEDGEMLTFEWDFGDGSLSTLEIPDHSYAESGKYLVQLTVTDEDGLSQWALITIEVGGPPTATILSPQEGSQFYTGQILHLMGEAKDSNGNALDDSQIEWEVRKHHAEHFHPFLDRTVGNDVDLFPAPEPEDYLAATNSFLEIVMYATDDNGLTTVVTQNVQPVLVFVSIDSDPQGLEVLVDDYPVTTPLQITSWKNHVLRIQVDDQPPYNFSSWADGSDRSRSIQLNDTSKPALQAAFCLVQGSECSASMECCNGNCFSGSCTVTDPTLLPSKSPSFLVKTDAPAKVPTDAPDVDIGDLGTLSPTMSSTRSPTFQPEATTVTSVSVSPSDMSLDSFAPSESQMQSATTFPTLESTETDDSSAPGQTLLGTVAYLLTVRWLVY